MSITFRRRSSFLISLLLVLSILLGAGMPSQAARTTATVKNPILNVRSSPSTGSSIVCKLTQGTKVNILGETTGDDGMKWYNVYFAYNGDAKEGYVRADLVSTSGSASNTSPSSGSSGSAAQGTRYVKPAVALVRSIATTNGDIRSRLEKGTAVTLLKSVKGNDDGLTWYKVSYTKDGSSLEGYMRGDLLSETNPGGSASGSNSTDVSGTRYINTNGVRVRSYASTNGDIRSRLGKGTPVSLISSKTGDDGQTWYKVSYTDNGYQLSGYVRSDLISEGNPGSSGNTSSGIANTPATVKPAIANIRSISSTDGDIRSKLPSGTQVKILLEKTGADGWKWYKISYTYGGNAMEGYIRSDLLNVGSTAPGSGSSGSSGSSNSTAVAQVRSYASPYGDIRATLENGTKVTILKEVTGEDGQKWTKIAFTQNGKNLEGYIPSSLLK